MSASSVPPPWTPIEGDEDSLRVWGREFTLDAGPLPVAVTVRGTPLSARPLTIRVDGEAVGGWRRSSFEKTASAAHWDAEAGTADAAVHARARVEVAYDGFWDVACTLTGGRAERVEIEIPLVGEAGEFVHRVLEVPPATTNTAELPQGDGVVWRSPFQCGVWVGNDDAGIHWCASDDGAFDLSEPASAITVERLGGEVVLRITLLDHAVDALDVHTRFGLMATPVKPTPAPAPRWRVGPGSGSNLDVLWWQGWTDTHANTVPTDHAALRAASDAARAAGRRVLPYFALLILSEASSAFTEGRAREWRSEPHFSNQDEGTRYWLMCPDTGWAAFLADEVERVVRECGLRGVYFDFFMPLPCTAAHHGGRTSYNVFAFRSMAKDIYERVKAVDPDAVLMIHCGDAMMYSSVGFGDVLVSGEYKRSQLAAVDGHYVDVLPLAELRAASLGSHAGLVPVVLPEFATPEGTAHPAWSRDASRARELLALLLVHDIDVWPIYCDAATVEKARAALHLANADGAQFVGYWHGAEQRVDASRPGLTASAWFGGAGEGALVAVANFTDDDVAGAVRMSGIAARSARDAETGAALAVDDGAVAVEVPARDYRLVRVT